MQTYFNPGDDVQRDSDRQNGSISYTISGYISRAPATGAMWAVCLAPIMNMFYAPDNCGHSDKPTCAQITSLISLIGF